MYAGHEKPSEVALYAFDCQYIEGSALQRSILGADADWTTTNQLLAMVADNTTTQIWMKTKDAEKGKNRPKQIPRPGVKDEETTTYGKGSALSMDDMRSWLGWDK